MRPAQPTRTSRWRPLSVLLAGAIPRLSACGVAATCTATNPPFAPVSVRQLIHYLNRNQTVAGFIWFDHAKEADWRLASTPESVAAFAEKLGRRCR